MLGHLRRIYTSSAASRSPLRILLHCCAVFLFLICVRAHAATTEYYYDDLGRVVQAIGSDGTIRQYQYDENGNVTAINRISGNGLTVSGLSPTIGHVTASVAIYGTGFSAVPSENAVRFGSIPAVVTDASTTRLVATVPQGAVL